MRIYFAAPLHDPEDRERNKACVTCLRLQAHDVYLPQEHGVWEEMLESYGGDVDKVKRLLNEKDKQAVQACDVIVAYCGDRRPSEGMLWEMGFGVALHKTVLLYNPAKWDFNLMIEYNAIVFEEWIPLERWLAEEDWNR